MNLLLRERCRPPLRSSRSSCAGTRKDTPKKEATLSLSAEQRTFPAVYGRTAPSSREKTAKIASQEPLHDATEQDAAQIRRKSDAC
jgi:hypothetical protein